MNKAMIMGRITRDLELKYTQSNVAVVSFSVAVDRAYKPKDGERETDFINCVAWRQNAEFLARWFAKGRMVAICGSIQTRKYTDKDGNQRTSTEVIAEDIYFCGDRSNAQGGDNRSYGNDNRNFDSGSQYRSEQPSSQLPAGDFSDISGDDDDGLPF